MSARPADLSMQDLSTAECLIALQASCDRVSRAATRANDLLQLSGNAGARGDTADDLHNAVAMHSHLLHQFQLKLRASSSHDEHQLHDAESISPSDADLARAHKVLQLEGTLDEALKIPAMSTAIHSYARGQRRRNAHSTDFKSLAANDRD